MDIDKNENELNISDEEFLKNQDMLINQINDLSITTHNRDLVAMYNDVVELKSDIIKKEKIKAVDISEITKYISKKYSTAHNYKLFSALLDAIGRGNNKLSQNMLEQTLDIKADWVDAIQDGIIAMQKIVSKPKLALREERDLVKVERAKRVDAVAVRHLSTHTQFIKLVREDGSVVPSNIMTRNLEDELAIYENRFLYALLQRLKSFVGKRYTIIMDHAKIKDNIALSYTSNFKYGRAEIDCRLNIGVKMDKEMTQTQAENIRLLNRLKFIKDQIAALEASPFMRAMRKTKMVLPPIQRTNILKSNPEYSLCYNLWVMLSNYNTVGYSVNLVEKQLPFDEAYYQDLTKIAATGTHVMLINNKVREAIYAQVKPTKVVQKEFKVRKSSSFLTNVFSSKRRANMKDINDFYYQRMKSMILNLSDLADALSVSSERDIPKKSLFKSIFKQIQQINNDMYTDILKIECLKSDKKEAETLQEKIEMQKKLCERYKQLTQLKEEVVKQALAEEKAQNKKLEKLEQRLEKQKLAEKLKAKKEKEQHLKGKKTAEKSKADEKAREREFEKQKKLEEIKKEKEKKLKEKIKLALQAKKEKAKKLLAEKREKEKARLALKKEKAKQLLAEKREKAKKALQEKRAKAKQLLAEKREKAKQLLAEKKEKIKKKQAVKKPTSKKVGTEKVTDKKQVDEKVAIKKPATKKAVDGKDTSKNVEKKPTSKKTTATKPVEKKPASKPAEKVVEKETTTKKTTTKKTIDKKVATKKQAQPKEKKAEVKKVSEKKTPTKNTASKKASAKPTNSKKVATNKQTKADSESKLNVNSGKKTNVVKNNKTTAKNVEKQAKPKQKPVVELVKEEDENILGDIITTPNKPKRKILKRKRFRN